MKIKSIKLKDFKRFTDLSIEGLPETAKLVVMIGPNGCGKSSVFDAMNFYFYIVKNRIYLNPSDTVQSSPFKARSVSDYYIKNDHPVPRNFLMTLDDLRTLVRYVNIMLHHEQKTKADELWVHIRSSLRNYLLPLDSDLFLSHSVEKLKSVEKLQYVHLNRLPTEKEEDHTFALNHWALVLFERELELEQELGKLWQSVIPPELRQYGQMVLNSRTEIVQETLNATAKLLTNPVSKLILEDLPRFRRRASDDSELVPSNKRVPAFYNLSAGEIAMFDLILDIVIKRIIDDETIICIDEPELHIHTKLQGPLLEELYNLIPNKSQLWIATHSIGMVRKAQDLWREDPDSVVFLDFGRGDFAEQVTLKPTTPDPDFWSRTYEVVLGDLAELVVTGRTVFCEGEEFDEECYRNIFKDTYPEACFVSLGARGNVEKSVTAANLAIEKIVKSAKVIGIVDRDQATAGEIKRNAKKGIRTLSRKTIESYLLDDEVLTKLCADHGESDKINDLLTAKQDALDKNNLKSSDNLKPIVQQVHGAAQRILKSANLGNTKDSFMMDILAPRIQPGMKVYEQLEKDIFGE